MTTSQAPVVQRSHTGCWTCKRRRRKCGEEKPTCQLCAKAGFECEGYETRLRWGTGVASRGPLTGSKNPVRQLAPPRQRGRQRDRLKQQRRKDEDAARSGSDQSPASSVFTYDEIDTLPPLDDDLPMFTMCDGGQVERERLYQEFLTKGCFQLCGGCADENPMIAMVPHLCESSATLYSVCVACQAYMTQGFSPNFHNYYDTALSQFRYDLSDPQQQLSDALLVAGTLLCTIGILQGTPFIVHLIGLNRMLECRGGPALMANANPYMEHIVEVISIIDLSPFVLGRQSPSLNLWQRYCSRRNPQARRLADAVEPMSGLPRSLIDIFSLEDPDVVEEELWLWPGYAGHPIQCHLWEAYRLAGMIEARRRKPHVTIKAESQLPTSSGGSGTSRLPSDEVLVARCIGSIEATRHGAAKQSDTKILVMNSIMYPLFTVGVEVMQSVDQKRKDLIKDWYMYEIDHKPSSNSKVAWDVLEEVRRWTESGRAVRPEQIARDFGIEISLL